MSYYIINLVETRKNCQLVFLSQGYRQDSPDRHQALIVQEDHLIASLDRYDNGRTTRAVLTTAIENHTGDWRELVGWDISESKGAAA